MKKTLCYRNVAACEIEGSGWDFYLYGADDPENWVWVGAIAYPITSLPEEEIRAGLEKWIDRFIESAYADADCDDEEGDDNYA